MEEKEHRITDWTRRWIFNKVKDSASKIQDWVMDEEYFNKEIWDMLGSITLPDERNSIVAGPDKVEMVHVGYDCWIPKSALEIFNQKIKEHHQILTGYFKGVER